MTFSAKDRPPLLTICIPTYNRAELLGAALDAILGQVNESNASEVAVRISDNASTDETPQAVSALLRKYPDVRIQYVRQPANISADANFLSLIECADGEFVFLLSDDDILLPGAVSLLLKMIKAKPELSAICLNATSFLNNPGEKNGSCFALDDDLLLKDKDVLLQFFGTYTTHMSLLAFRKSLVDCTRARMRIGTGFIHSYIFLELMAQCPVVYITKDCYLATRGNNTGGYNFFQVFATHFHDLMRHAEAIGYSRAAVAAVMQKHLRQFITTYTLLFKKQGSVGRLKPDLLDGARRVLREYGPQPYVVFVLLPLMLAPAILVRPLHRMYQMTKARRHSRSLATAKCLGL